MNKAIFKKWWFWITVLVVLGGIGSLGQSGNKSDNSATPAQTSTSRSAVGTLPKLNADDYLNNEGLVVYKELKAKGYKVDATFENQALTDINGKATDVFEPLDPNKSEDKLSVDAFKVGKLTQDGDNVTLTIVKSTN